MHNKLVAAWAVSGLLIGAALGVPVATTPNVAPALSVLRARGTDDWKTTLSEDTRHRLAVSLLHLDDASDAGQVFRNDTIMRINIEREAQELPLISLWEAFGLPLPAPQVGVTAVNVEERDVEDREHVYTRSGTMTGLKTRDVEDREHVYTRSGTMTGLKTRDVEDREHVYTRSGTMTGLKARNTSPGDSYGDLLDRDNLALGAIERINVARRVLGKPVMTVQEATEMGASGDAYLAGYWNASMQHGAFWTGDQPAGQPNFIEGGQDNGYGYTMSTFHQLHCLANLRTMLGWHMTGHGDMVTRDMNAHTIHCLEYIRSRQLAVPDETKEPIDTVDYKAMGIH